MVGRPGSDGIEIATVDDAGAGGPRRGRRPWLQVSAAIVVVALVVAGVVLFSGGDGDGRAGRRQGTTKVVTDPVAQRTVAAALGASTGTGGYEVSYDFVIDPPSPSRQVCQPRSKYSHGYGPGDVSATGAAPDGAVVATGGRATGEVCFTEGRPQVTVSGRGTVHLNPYLLETTSTVSGLGEIAVKTDGNAIVEQGGGNYGSLNDGQPLSGFASLVQGTFGEGPGALTMLGLASPTGYLSLSADAVTGVTAAGTGVVNGVPVTYYDVVSDTAAMQRLPGLTDEQRKTITAALAVLATAGFEEARTRVAIDADGYVRESDSTASFSDGTKMSRHMTLSRFGCIGAGPTPVDPTGTAANLPPECSTPPPTTAPVAAEPTTTTTMPPAPTTTTPYDTTPPSSSGTLVPSRRAPSAPSG